MLLSYDVWFVETKLKESFLSFENERRRRINTILEVLASAGKQGVVPQLLYQRVAPEITKERLFIYLEELSWAGIVAKGRDGKIRLVK